jgi:hypothetical protein
MTNSVFISYRRSDSTGEAGRLAESLERLLGAACVFRDADDIPGGADFDAVLREQLAGTKAVLVLIGKRWLAELADRAGKPEPDYVRIEIATALSSGKRVIPILLQGAELPKADALPVDVRPLLRHQGVTLRDEAWQQDAERVADAVGRPYRWGRVALRALATVCAILFAVKFGIVALVEDPERQLGAARGAVAVLVVAYVWLEATLWRRSVRRQSFSSAEAISPTGPSKTST